MFVRLRAFACSRRRTFLVLLSFLSGATASAQSSAQVILRAEAERAANSVPAQGDAPVSHSEREYEYHQLQQEASILERQLGLVRKIVRLASPTVVHIEASKKSEAGHGLASSRVDEAGAGVIVQIRNQLYVLTNRHVVHPAEPSAIRIELSNVRQLRPIKIWADPSTDVAAMQIDGRDLVPARLGDSDKM